MGEVPPEREPELLDAKASALASGRHHDGAAAVLHDDLAVGNAADEDEFRAGRIQGNAIADAAVYFASDESRFVVGGELIVDGGMSNL